MNFILDFLLLLSNFVTAYISCAHSMDILNSILWWPSGKCEKLVSMDEENLFLWSLDCSKKAAQVQVLMEVRVQ